MWILNLSLALLLQSPATPTRVIVGLIDGQKVVVDNPKFTGFIRGRDGDIVLVYRQNHVHGQMSANVISRIEFGIYTKHRPFPMTVTLRNGQKLDVLGEGSNFVTLNGDTDIGTVRIKHPDPNSAPLRLTKKKPNRSKDLSIQYLEFTGS
jgi:hypothetical protein